MRKIEKRRITHRDASSPQQQQQPHSLDATPMSCRSACLHHLQVVLRAGVVELVPCPFFFCVLLLLFELCVGAACVTSLVTLLAGPPNPSHLTLSPAERTLLPHLALAAGAGATLTPCRSERGLSAARAAHSSQRQ